MNASPIAAALAAANNGNGFVCYGTGEPVAHALARTYQAGRLAGLPAADALRKARERVASGERLPWPHKGAASYQNKPNERGGRWIERPDLAGLRFVGFADELNRHIGHTGWFQYPDGDPGDVYHGVVYRLPARGGRSQYVEGYVSGESTRGGFRETSSGRTGGEHEWPAVVFLADRHAGEPGGAEGAEGDDSAIRDAASGADSEAESAGERERDYQESYQHGRNAAEAIEAADAERADARELMRELRGLASLPAAVCAELRGSIAGKLRRARRGYAKAAALWREHGEPVTWRPDLADAFAEAAGAASYWESRRHA